MNKYLIISGIAVFGAASTLLFFRYLHAQDVQAVEAAIQGASSPAPCQDLPEAVYALAARLGAHADAPSAFVTISQKGGMFMKEGSTDEMAFTAKQYMSTTACRFSWHARSYWGLVCS